MTSVEARGVVDGYGSRRVLDGVDLAVSPGEAVALVGPNAAGKSTLLRLLAGERTPLAGSILLDGRPVQSWRGPERAVRLALVPQSSREDVEFTGAEMVALGRTARTGGWSLGGHEEAAAVSRALADADAAPLADRPFRTLSGGERQRILFARALAQDAASWLLDEPTAHLDLAHQWLVVEAVRRKAATGGAVLWVLHDLTLAARLPRVAVLSGGRIVADGAPRAVLTPSLLADVWKVRARWTDDDAPALLVEGRTDAR